ncbi:hypothetical protein SRHO_G00216050 [Serrasalmus rhombeus]
MQFKKSESQIVEWRYKSTTLPFMLVVYMVDTNALSCCLCAAEEYRRSWCLRAGAAQPEKDCVLQYGSGLVSGITTDDSTANRRWEIVLSMRSLWAA